MKFTNAFYLTMTVLLGAFPACTQKDGEQLLQGNEIKLTSRIMPDTRTTDQDLQSIQIVEGQQVGVTIIGATSEHKNVSWTVGKDGTLKNSGTSIFWSDDEITVTSYHPFNKYWVGSNHTFSVNADQSTDSGYLNSDLLWASTTASMLETPISLSFSHKLAKINVTLSSDDITDLSGAIIYICGTNVSTGFNPETGTLFATTGRIAEIKSSVTTKDAYTASAVIVPQTVTKGTPLIKIIYNNREFLYTLSEDMAYESGYSYNYTLKVKDSNMENPTEDEETDW